MLTTIEQSGLENLGVTGEVQELPKGKRAINSKQMFQQKRFASREIDKYKVRIVAQGFIQIYGDNFHDTYLPVISLILFHIIIAIAGVSTFLGHLLLGKLISTKLNLSRDSQ